MAISMIARVFLLTVCLFALELVDGTQVCYSPFGCFSSDGDDVRAPQDPLTIDTHFKLFTRKHRHVPYREIGGKNWNSLVPDFAAHFNGSKLTKILIHGFLDRGNTAWISNIRDALLNKGDFNILIVDWNKGSRWPYEQATGNSFLVGAELSLLLQYLYGHSHVRPSDVHIIAHSLGAQVAGQAGKLLSGKIARISEQTLGDIFPTLSVPRKVCVMSNYDKRFRKYEIGLTDRTLQNTIYAPPENIREISKDNGIREGIFDLLAEASSALDPADPGFTGKPVDRRLDASDAMYVDVIHTDGSHFNLVSGYGTTAPLGDVDFYPNGGEHQPGCVEKVTSNALAGIFNGAFGSTVGVLTCSHSRAHIYYLESITTTCKFRSHKCRSQADFDAGKCRHCPPEGCPLMGYEADLYQARGTYFLATSSSSKFCGKEYFVDIHVSQTMKTTYGELFVTLIGSKASSEELKFTKLMRQYHANDLERHVVATHTDIGQVKQAKVRFIRGHDLHSLGAAHEISIKSVTVAPADDQSLGVMFCGGDVHIQDNSTAILRSNGVC